jgi:hypothetical protein
MRMLIPILLLLLFISSCNTSESHQRYVEEQRRKLSIIYQVGIPRDDLSTKLNAKPYASANRPEGGWAASPDPLIARFAQAVEKRNSITVQHCDLYQVPRETSLSSVPMALGFYFDYLAFDQNDKLVDFYRRFMD